MEGRDFLVDSQERANQKGEFHGLGIVEPRVTVRLESEREVGLGQLLTAPNTLRHVFPGALNVNPAEPTPVGTVDLSTFPDFRKNVIKLPGLVAILRRDAGVPMTRVTGPDHLVAGGLNGLNVTWEELLNLRVQMGLVNFSLQSPFRFQSRSNLVEKL